MHGLCWSYRLTDRQALLPIAVLEAVAYVWSILIFEPYVAPLPSERASTRAVVGECDALSAVFMLHRDSPSSPAMQFVFEYLEGLPQMASLRPCLHNAHCYGPGNFNHVRPSEPRKDRRLPTAVPPAVHQATVARDPSGSSEDAGLLGKLCFGGPRHPTFASSARRITAS